MRAVPDLLDLAEPPAQIRPAQPVPDLILNRRQAASQWRASVVAACRSGADLRTLAALEPV